MTFDEWFKDFKDVGIGTYTIEALKQAFEAGLHADVHTDNSKVIVKLEECCKEWQRTCEAKSDTNAQLIEQLAEKNEIITELKKDCEEYSETFNRQNNEIIRLRKEIIGLKKKTLG